MGSGIWTVGEEVLGRGWESVQALPPAGPPTQNHVGGLSIEATSHARKSAG